MDETKEKGGSVAITTESTVTVSETVVETMVCEGQVQIEEDGEGGPSNGDDIMVEVLGSHVYVDGICTTDGGGGGEVGGDSNDEAIRDHGESGEVGLEGKLTSSDGEGDAAGDLGSRDKVSGGEVSSADVRGKAQNEVNGAGVKGSGAPATSAVGEAVKTAECTSRMDEGGRDAEQTSETRKAGDLEGDELNHGNQKVVVCSSAASEDSSVKTQIVDEAAKIANGEGLNATDGAHETISEGTKKAAAVDADSKFSHVKIQVTAKDVPSEAKDSVHSSQLTELVSEGQLDDKVNPNIEINKQGTDSPQLQIEVNNFQGHAENHATGNDQSLISKEVTEGGEEVDPSMGEGMDVEKQVSDAKNVGFDAEQDVEGQEMNVDEQVVSAEQDGLDQVQEMEVEEDHDTDSEQPTNIDEKTGKRAALKPASAVKVQQAKYQILLEEKGDFSVSDLVWGKVRSHPWWPGQIFDPSDASEKAVKYHKKDSFLVAYFGDRTFAWNEASLLKPFRSHFSQIVKQSNMESFQNAVNCALEEVSRRVELGFACSCIPQDVYDKIKFQKVENTGVRQESSTRVAVDMSFCAGSFEPDKLVDYMKELAESASDGADHLDLVIAKAQLLAFYRLKGYHQLPEFQFCGGLSENEAHTSNSEVKMHSGEVIEQGSPMDTDGEQISTGQESSKTKRSTYLKRKHNLKDGLYPSKKERSLSELMGDTFDSPDGENGSDTMGNKLMSPSGKKRKAVDSFEDSVNQEGRKTISLAKVSVSTPNVPKPSFKIGECIRRAASQMTGSPSILKSSGDRLQKLDGGSENPAADGFDVPFDNSEDALRKRMNITSEYSSLDELLSQLLLAACDPMGSYSSLNIIITFFSDFRDSLVLDQFPGDKAGGKRKKPNFIMGSPETFEFEDMNDTYWTDRIVQNGSEEHPLQGNGRGQYQIVPVELEKPVHRGRKSRKRYSDANHDLTGEKPPGYVNERAPAELVMNFSEINSVPSEIKLNKMFKHFGPLKESETEVDRETSRARVVFRRSSDAEVAYNSAGKFNIFGPVAVNYQLNYTISESFKASLYAPTLAEETPLMVSGLGADHALVASTLGEDASLISPGLGEEASFMVSTLGEDTLPISTTFHEDSSIIASTLGDDSLAIHTTLGDGSSLIATTMYEETFPITTTAGEGTMAVPSIFGDQTFMVPTTVYEHCSTIVTTITEETSTAATSLGEETSMADVSLGGGASSIATAGEETSTIPTTLDAETPSIPTALAEETPNNPSTLNEETPIYSVTLAEETSTVTPTFSKETPALPPTISEDTPTIPTNLDQETQIIPTTTGAETTTNPATLGVEPTTDPTTLHEEPTTDPTTLHEETTTVPTTLHEETTTSPTVLAEETLTDPSKSSEETPTDPTTLGEETPTDTPTLVEETPTDTAILGDETPTDTTSLGEESPADPTTLHEEKPTLGEETPTNPTTLGMETLTVPTTMGDETSTDHKTLDGEAISEEKSTISTTTDVETLPPVTAEGEKSAT